MKKSWTVLVFVALGFSLPAQRLYPNSLAIGLKTSVAQTFVSNAPTVSLDLNQQANISDFFSLRTGLISSYFFPVSQTIIYQNDPNQRLYNAQYLEVSSLHFGLTTMPMYYFRDEGFALFFGLGGGIGLQLETLTYYEELQDGSRTDKRVGNPDAMFQLGWKPVVGASFKIGTKTSPSEIELSLSRESWHSVLESNPDKFNWVGLAMAYRYNFRE